LDQPGQRCVHRIVEIGISEAPVQPQTRDNTVKEDAALLDWHPVGGVPDDPKLRIGQGEHVGMVLATVEFNRFSLSGSLRESTRTKQHESKSDYEKDG
jgi:hypothetical protein